MTVCRYSRLLPAAGLMLAVFAGAAGARQAQAPPARQAAPLTVAPLPSATERVPVRPPHHHRAAGERAALLHPSQPAPREAGRAPPRDQRGLGARRGRSARAGARRRAHGLQRHEALCRPGDHGVHGVDRHAVRAEPERLHDVRRHDVRPEGADRPRRDPREGLADPRGLGAQPDVRRPRNRQGAGRHHRGMAPGARGGGPAPGHAVSDRARRIAVCGSEPDRHDGIARVVLARAAEAVLPGLVPHGPDGRRRRR